MKRPGIMGGRAFWAILAISACPVLLAAQAGSRKAADSRQVIDMDVYRICVPPGGGWDIETDREAGRVALRKAKSAEIVSLLQAAGAK